MNDSTAYPRISQAIGLIVLLMLIAGCVMIAFLGLQWALGVPPQIHYPMVETAACAIAAAVVLRIGIVRQGRRVSEQFVLAPAPLHHFLSVGLVVLGSGILLDGCMNVVFRCLARVAGDEPG